MSDSAETLALVCNCGECSVHFTLYTISSGELNEKCSGYCDQIGSDECVFKIDAGTSVKGQVRISDHDEAMAYIAKTLTDSGGLASDIKDIKVVGHRVVHGGKELSKPVVVDATIEAIIERNVPLAPRHNPWNLAGIKAARKVFPVAQVAVSDTAFHSTMPPESYRYALPTEVYEKFDVRRYGFHGISYKYVSGMSAAMLGKKLAECNFILCHIANSASMACMKNGEITDTTTGLTPNEGLMMGTRCGDVDAGVYTYLCQHVGMAPQEVESMINEESGLKGIAGLSDMREVVGKVGLGDKDAKLARNMFIYRVRKYLGAYLVALGGNVDAIVFTGLYGETDVSFREDVTADLQAFGIKMDSAANETLHCGEIQAKDSKVALLIVPTQEELSIARQAVETTGLAKMTPLQPSTKKVRPRLSTGRTRRFSLTPDMLPKIFATSQSTYLAMGGFLIFWAMLAGVGAYFGRDFANDLMASHTSRQA